MSTYIWDTEYCRFIYLHMQIRDSVLYIFATLLLSEVLGVSGGQIYLLRWKKRAEVDIIWRNIVSVSGAYVSPDYSVPNKLPAGPSVSRNCPLAVGACARLRLSCRLHCFRSASCRACHRGRCLRYWNLVLCGPGAVSVQHYIHQRTKRSTALS